MKTPRGMIVVLLACVIPANASDILIESFDRNGEITFNEIPQATGYRVEWAPAPGQVWTSSWDTLTGLHPTGSGVVTATVPMVYRVLADISPTGFVMVTKGTFTMGSPTDEPGRGTDETQHEVTLTRDFAIQRTEVTNRQMADLLNWVLAQPGANIAVLAGTAYNLEGRLEDQKELLDLDGTGCQISWTGSELVVDPGKEEYPCIEVTWFGAQAYCNYLSDQEGRTRAITFTNWNVNLDADGYRLPTEAEWEYACRAGTATAFYTGDITHPDSDPVDPNLNQAGWYWGNSTNPDNAFLAGKGSHLVGQKLGNAWELFDLHGNLQEWCAVSGSFQIVRGGSWLQEAKFCRSANRELLVHPISSNWSIGFRPVRTSVP